MIPLNAQDEAFLKYETQSTRAHVGGLEILRLPADAGPDFMQKLYRSLRSAPVRAEPFNYLLVSHKPETAGKRGWIKGRSVRAWEIVEVDAADHVHMHALPWPGGQRELGELVSRLHSIPLDPGRPLWEVHVIEGLEGGRYAVYTKVHHSQFDGVRGMALAKFTRSPDPKVRGLPPLWAVELPKSETKPERKGRARKTAHAAAAAGPLDDIANWGKAIVELAQVRLGASKRGLVAPLSSPASIFNGQLTARRRLGTQSVPIERLRAIGAAFEGGATVNEVLLAVIGGALRRYLKERDALPDASLTATVPVALPRGEDHSGGNAVGQILVALGTDIASPKPRLKSVVASSHANKELMKGMDPEVYDHYTMAAMIPQFLAARTPFGDRVLNSNLTISNVPGPREPQYVNGALIEHQYTTSLLLPGQALNITAIANRGALDIGVLACPDLCASPQKIAVYLGEEVALLEKALGIAGAAARKAAPPRPRKSTQAAAEKTAATPKKTAKTAKASKVAKTAAAPRKAATKTTPQAAKPAAKKAAAKRKPAKAAPARPARKTTTRSARKTVGE